MDYKILIKYRTGNSYGSHNEEDFLELSWNNLEIAKESLQAIKEHYSIPDENNYSTNSQELLKRYLDNFWFVNDKKYWSLKRNQAADKHTYDTVYIDQFSAYHCLNLKTDIGTLWRISAFWKGYFERLISAEITIDNSDLKIEF